MHLTANLLFIYLFIFLFCYVLFKWLKKYCEPASGSKLADKFVVSLSLAACWLNLSLADGIL